MNKVPLGLRDKPFTFNQALESGLTRRQLKGLVLAGEVEQLARGMYRAAQADVSEEDQFRVASLRVGKPSAICLVSALAHHHLTDTIPKKTWIMVPISKRTTARDLKVFRTRNPDWEIGIEERDGYAITSVERTLVDCLMYRTRVGTRIGVEGLRRALESKQTTLGKVMDMAVKLKSDHRIRPYIEALA